MFSNCKSLSELNKRRQELVKMGESLMEVNSAYNKAKKVLLDAAPSYRTIPSYSGEDVTPKVFCTLPIISDNHNYTQIVITQQGVLL